LSHRVDWRSGGGVDGRGCPSLPGRDRCSGPCEVPERGRWHDVAPIVSGASRVARHGAFSLRYQGPRLVLARHRPSTLAVTGPPAHSPCARWAVRFAARRDAAHRGPLEASVTDIRTDFGADEGSARKIPVGSHEPSNHDFRPRAGTRPDGTHRSRIANHRSPPDARGRRSFVLAGDSRIPGAPDWRGGRGPERGIRRGRRTAGDLRRSL
jgi:hypothetical protein